MSFTRCFSTVFIIWLLLVHLYLFLSYTVLSLWWRNKSRNVTLSLWHINPAVNYRSGHLIIKLAAYLLKYTVDLLCHSELSSCHWVVTHFWTWTDAQWYWSLKVLVMTTESCCPKEEGFETWVKVEVRVTHRRGNKTSCSDFKKHLRPKTWHHMNFLLRWLSQITVRSVARLSGVVIVSLCGLGAQGASGIGFTSSKQDGPCLTACFSYETACKWSYLQSTDSACFSENFANRSAGCKTAE